MPRRRRITGNQHRPAPRSRRRPSGATQNSQSWAERPPADEQRRPVLRAGFTDVFVTGMRDQVDQRQRQADGERAHALGARRSVAPRMTIRKTAVSTTSVTSAAPSE